MHRRSLERFAFDSVLLPYNARQLQDRRYAEEFEALAQICAERGVACRRSRRSRSPPGRGGRTTASTWYEPLTDPADIEIAVDWVLGRPGVFLNTVGSVELLPHVLAAAERFDGERPSEEMIEGLLARNAFAPLFT